MKIDFSAFSSLYTVFDDETNQLFVSDDTTIQDVFTRKMSDMRNLFPKSDGFADDLDLYYMYNGIARAAHKDFFEKAEIKYELTILPPMLINGEVLKAHGHIHSIRPIQKTRHVEVYEILHGEGYFQMFREVEGKLETILMKVKPGDRFLIPGDYFHLSMNTGNVPFVFGDLITTHSANDYGPLKIKNGAPFFGMKDDKDQLSFVFNKNYDLDQLEIKFVDIDALPWANPVLNLPLYSHFLARPEAFDYLSK